MNRSDAEALGWVVTAEQPEIGYVLAEKLLLNGDLIHQSGETVGEVVAAIEAWEDYPVQAVDTRGPVDTVVDAVVPEPDDPTVELVGTSDTGDVTA